MKRTLPLPMAPDEVTPSWLTAVLREAGALQHGRVAAVSWEIVGEEQGFTGVVARLRPRYVAMTEENPALPSLIAKFPTAERRAPSAYRATLRRDPGAARRHYERCAREVRFYREIAPSGPVPVPRLYYGVADDEKGRVVLLLEDLAGARVGDVLSGCSPEEAALVVEAMASLHARWWARLGADTFPWLPRWGGDHLARQERYDRQIGPFLERFGREVPPPIRDLVERLRMRYAAVLAALDRAPATVIHADLHLDNVLFNSPGAEPSVVVLDWQGVSQGPAAVDLALFVFGSLPTQQRRATENDLFRRYHALLAEHGVNGYTVEQLRDDCRLALLWQLAGTVGWLAGVDVDQLVGRERALVDAAVGNGWLAAALLDHDVAALLPRLG